MLQLPVNLKRILKTLVKIAGVFLLLTLAGYLGFRNFILHKAIERISEKLTDRFQLVLTVNDAGFSGLSTVNLTGLKLIPAQGDTLLSIDTLKVNFRLIYALIGDIRISEVGIHSGYAQLTKVNGKRNFDFLFPDSLNHQDSLPKQNKKYVQRGFAKTAFRLIEGLLDHVPAEMHISRVSFKINDEGTNVVFTLNRCMQLDDNFDADIMVQDQLFETQRWQIRGMLNPGSRIADLHFFPAGMGKIFVPYLNQRINLIAGFDSIHVELDEISYSNNQLHIRGQSDIKGFTINHPKISRKDVEVAHAGIKYHFLFGEHFISLDSSTSVTFNQIRFHPFVKLDVEKDTVFSLSVAIPDMPAQDFITSLPEGLFTHFKGMEIDGRFAYRLDFRYNENQPQDLLFESVLKKQNLVIRKFGEANLSKLNTEFIHIPFEYGRPQRPILIGAANPMYTPLDQISPYLQKCVLTTEDPSFYYHRGFIDEAFRQSIVKNIRKRKFARGASTISMQLVKNVFLTREKTISRKLEEILLVYILENNRISSKERMLEVYFNLIEWGPGVYGIGEASAFYFNKRPKDLALNECLFLATVIPRPKSFMWRFDQEGMLKPFAQKQFRFLTELMTRRLLLEAKDSAEASKTLQLTGPAKQMLRLVPDTLIQDSALLDENGLNNQPDE